MAPVVVFRPHLENGSLIEDMGNWMTIGHNRWWYWCVVG